MADASRNKPGPDWFKKAMDAPIKKNALEIDGCTISYRSWGSPDRPGMMMLHGSRAHALWYGPVAPLLAQRFYVVTPDLSGNGDSSWRDSYTMEQWARETVAVAAHSGLFNGPVPPVFVGHSVGGGVALRAAQLCSDKLLGVVLADAFRQPMDDDPVMQQFLGQPRPTAETERKHRVYKTREEATEKFELYPAVERPYHYPALVDYVAGHAVRRTDAGWTWKFDPNAYRGGVMPLEEMNIRAALLAKIDCPAAAIIAEHSHLLDPGTLPWLEDVAGWRFPHFIVTDCHHHIMLDQPLAFVAGLEAIALNWLAGLPGHS